MYRVQYKCAILITCHNRKDKTLAFLKSLTAQSSWDALQKEVYLLDDGSTDGTADAIKVHFPFVIIIKGTGNLFWAGGMRFLWQHVLNQKTYDLYFLFNDDVVLLDGALEKLTNCHGALSEKGTILIGSTLSPVSNKISYGGNLLYRLNHAKYHVVTPHQKEPLPCHLGNANIFLVDAATVDKIGIFKDAYTHYLADYDYTLTAFKADLNVFVAPGFYGYCEDDHGVNWLSGNHSLEKRLQYLFSPKGLAYKEYLFYIREHFPADYLGALIKLWMKTLFPIIWDKFKKASD